MEDDAMWGAEPERTPRRSLFEELSEEIEEGIAIERGGPPREYEHDAEGIAVVREHGVVVWRRDAEAPAGPLPPEAEVREEEGAREMRRDAHPLPGVQLTLF